MIDISSQKLISFVEQNNYSFFPENSPEDTARRKLLIHILRHKNGKLYEENKEVIESFINKMIEISKNKVVKAQEKYVADEQYWSMTRAKIAEILTLTLSVVEDPANGLHQKGGQSV